MAAEMPTTSVSTLSLTVSSILVTLTINLIQERVSCLRNHSPFSCSLHPLTSIAFRCFHLLLPPMSTFTELTHSLESLTHRSPDWDFLDTILHTLLVSPTIPEKTLDICRHTCSQLLSDDAWLTAMIDPPSCRRLFNVLVNVGNLMHRIDNTISATTQCYVHAIEVVVQKPESCYSPKVTKVSFRDVIVAAWATALNLSLVHASSIPSSAIHALVFSSPGNILSRIGDPNFDILQAVHDAGDDLIRVLIDPTTGNLPSIILFPEQIHRLSAFMFSSQNRYLSEATQFPAHSSPEQFCQESRTAISSVLLCLARRFQTSDAIEFFNISDKPFCTAEALSLIMHYLAASLLPNASALNDIGVLLCGFGSGEMIASLQGEQTTARDVARLYYEKGLQLDPSHPHLLSNLGSLLKDAGHMTQAIGIFNRALACHPELDIALVNMANTLRDTGRSAEAIPYYQRAISVNPDFADAYCGLSQAMNAVCCWNGRTTWMQKVIECCEKQLLDIHDQTTGLLITRSLDDWMTLVQSAQSEQLSFPEENTWKARFTHFLQDASTRQSWSCGEVGFFIRLIEWYKARIQHFLYIETHGQVYQSEHENATHSCETTTIPGSSLLSTIKNSRLPLILPFHTFTLPLTARTIRLIAHRNALHTSFTAFTLLGKKLSVHPVPHPPLHGQINVGYVSSDFTDHPLTHLMKSVFALHDKKRFNVFLYATSPTDGSSYRLYYERQDDFHFKDVSNWPVCDIIERITRDRIHILVNLGGYTKGSRNEIFAARPSPVQVSLMGFAGTLAAGWCDYLVCDPIVCPPDLFVQVFRARGRSPSARSRNEDITPDIGVPINEGSDPASQNNDWIYTECPIYMPHTYFATDHKQSYNFRDSIGLPSTYWADELRRRDQLRATIFPGLPEDVVIFANFNQLYKIDPIIFWTWLRILTRVPRSILWLLRFPAAGESNLLQAAVAWAGPEVASRIKFTDIAPKETHIARCCVADLFLDTAEVGFVPLLRLNCSKEALLLCVPQCSAHTIAADVLWSGTPIIACLWPSHRHKMASRVSASLAYATGLGKYMVVHNREEYEERAVALASTCWSSSAEQRSFGQHRSGEGEFVPEKSELLHLRRCLFLARETIPLFDTRRWVKNLEKGYVAAWRRWVDGSQFRVGYNNEGAIVVKDDEDTPDRLSF